MSNIEGYYIQNGEPTPDNPVEIESLDIEEDRVKKFIKAYEETKAQSFVIESINKDFFFEFTDCLIAKIKELEVLEDDLKDKRVVYIDTPEFAENYIPKQKVKDKIEELNNNRPYLMKFEDWRKKEYTNEDIIQNCIEVLEELLEDK